MAQTAEFEEKEYEQPLNVELLFDTKNLLWTPGQVFEEHFGIDAALSSGDPRLWILFGYPDIPKGVILNNFRWGYIWRNTHNKRELPTFQTNLLLQTKRPDHRKGNNASFTKHGIRGQYWQFEVTKHQQEALEKLYDKLNNRALVCYASAAFHSHKDLFQYIESQSLVDNSTFVKVNRMVKHKKWVYNQAGSVGIACSEIEIIQDDDFRHLIALASKGNDSERNPLDNLLSLEKSTIQAIIEINDKNPIKIEFNRRQKLMSDVFSRINMANIENAPAVKAFWTFNTICTLTNMTWFPIGQE